MNKAALIILGIVIGTVIGILVGKESSSPSATAPAPPDVHQYYYRLNDSMVARHTVTLKDSSVTHRVDTLALDTK